MRFVVTGHLHAHDLYMITSPDGQNTLTSLICAPAGNKVLPIPFLLPAKSRVKTLQYRSGITAYYNMTLDTYAAPNNGTTDEGPQSGEFNKLNSYAIPMD